ncbi:hypothetical protein CASFOL_013451 [Castilleja foliolosa]|uniref:PHD-type domain-containing protein n=1 Tax=Castilleja foliolosa TaxID=1961234 RepID=A0ABD3DK14_9LAMI
MKLEAGFEIERSGELQGSESETGYSDPARTELDDLDWMDNCNALRVRPSEANGFAVYTRSRRLKSRSVSRIGYLNKLGWGSGISAQAAEIVSSNSEVAVCGGDALTVGGAEGNLGILEVKGGGSEGEMMDIEVKEEPAVRRFARSVLMLKSNDDYEKENGNLTDTVILEADGLVSENLAGLGSPETRKMKMSKKILVTGRPTTVRELFETGLLEGYPVVYNGGKRGFPLRGTIKDAGILCSCSLCKGTRIRSFLATSAAKVEPLCDSCVIILNSEFDAECVKSRPLEPFLGFAMTENVEVHNTPKKRGRRGRKKRKHSENTNQATSTGKSSLRVSTRKKAQRKIMKMSSKLTSVVKSSENMLIGLSNTTSPYNSLERGSPSVSKITKKDQRMHKLVFENGGLPDGTEVAYYSNGKILRDGYKMGSGIICRCCSTLVSPSQFEAHAGRASRRKPYMYIYTSNGVSLHEYAVSLLKVRNYSSNDNGDFCVICADGGKLVLCDGCPRAFHKECASLSSIPHGKWYCTYCQNMFQRESFVEWNANAVAAGRISGIDSIEDIKNRCILHVKNPEEAEVIACVICRGYDFSKSGFGPRTVILCDQCEKEYHVGCLKKCKMADLKELPKGKWFCSSNCKGIYSALQNLLNTGAEKLPDPSLEIMKKVIEKSSVADTDFDVRWRLLNGKISSRETRVLLSQAVAIFHDSFAPIIDSETGRDFIPSLVYGRNIRGQDFSGMYCAILTVNSTVVSAGILRIFGHEVAELPLAATRGGNQGKGYFQILYSCIENLLASLNVKSLVLPATDDAKSIWTDKFGFEKIQQEHFQITENYVGK